MLNLNLDFVLRVASGHSRPRGNSSLEILELVWMERRCESGDFSKLARLIVRLLWLERVTRSRSLAFLEGVEMGLRAESIVAHRASSSLTVAVFL